MNIDPIILVWMVLLLIAWLIVLGFCRRAADQSRIERQALMLQAAARRQAERDEVQR